MQLRELAQRELADAGVHHTVAARLSDMGVRTVFDLLSLYPRRYHDRTKITEIDDADVGDEVVVIAEVRKVRSRRTRQGRALVELVVQDATRSLDIAFFNQAWRERQLPEGTEAAFFGKVDAYRGKLRMTNPVVDVLAQLGERTGVIMPIYPQSGKAEVSSWQIRHAVSAVFKAISQFDDPLDAHWRTEYKLVDRDSAYRGIHAPSDFPELRAAQRRLRFDEFLRMQLALVSRKRALARVSRGIRHNVDGALVHAFVSGLPYTLTPDQVNVLNAVKEDMGASVPMHRLVQGEVGSGKTVVSAAAMLMAVQGGHQAAFMAPTEVLAEQHMTVLRQLLAGLRVPTEGGSLFAERDVRVALLSGRTPAAQRRKTAHDLESGAIDIVVGTHALLYGEVQFASLGLCVIDEQHRFGVEQRAALLERAGSHVPDLLVMTATPIPRTAAMLVFGDLDQSEIRTMPSGRKPIVTEWLPGDAGRAAAYEQVRSAVQRGEQAYVICPLVEGSPRVEARAATELAEELQTETLAHLRVGLLHGQMPAAEKDAAMEDFRQGRCDVLVATTVIEVGIDVPNASVIVIEDADRFGLLQLHQLRGRVGRGSAASQCLLLSGEISEDAEARLSAMVECSDGFDLATRDLELRGMGHVFGERQAGLGDLRLGRLPRDAKYVEVARSTAEAILDGDSDLSEHAGWRQEVEDLLGESVEYLFKS